MKSLFILVLLFSTQIVSAQMFPESSYFAFEGYVLEDPVSASSNKVSCSVIFFDLDKRNHSAIVKIKIGSKTYKFRVYIVEQEDGKLLIDPLDEDWYYGFFKSRSQRKIQSHLRLIFFDAGMVKLLDSVDILIVDSKNNKNIECLDLRRSHLGS